MASELARGKTAFGGDWVVAVEGGHLIVVLDGDALIVEGAERDKFAEAVARAAMPGQVSDGD